MTPQTKIGFLAISTEPALGSLCFDHCPPFNVYLGQNGVSLIFNFFYVHSVETEVIPLAYFEIGTKRTQSKHREATIGFFQKLKHQTIISIYCHGILQTHPWHFPV